MRFENKTVIITGGGRGIGRAAASAFLREGACAVVVDKDRAAGEDCISSLSAAGPILFVHGNIADESVAQAAADTAAGEFGGLDFLVNNAAESAGGKIDKLSLSDWNRVLGTNLTAAFLFTKACAPLLRSRRGAIVNITSTRAVMSEPDTEAYSASKGGLLAFTHATAVSLGPEIRVNSVSPGWIDTSLWQPSGEVRQPMHSQADMLQHPAGRVGCPEDITSLILFLCSSDAGFITGADFTADGGMTRKMIYV